MTSKMLGLKHNINYLVDYDPQWEDNFAEERMRLKNALGDMALGIEHYGSTAVNGMKAKPILDIMVGVSPLDTWKACKAPLEQLGYDYAKHAGVPEHYIFGRGRDLTERTHLVHIVEYHGSSWASDIALRDALRADSLLRQAYMQEKERACRTAPQGRAEYNVQKGAFIAEMKLKMADIS